MWSSLCRGGPLIVSPNLALGSLRSARTGAAAVPPSARSMNPVSPRAQGPAGAAQANVPAGAVPRSLPRLIEIARVGRRLPFLGRHQIAVAAHVVGVLADGEPGIVLGADELLPDRLSIGAAAVALGGGPRTRERMIDGGDLVVEDVRIGLVLIDAFLDDGLIVLVQRQAGRIEDPRPLEAARLDLEHVVAAAATFLAPLADGIGRERRPDVPAAG